MIWKEADLEWIEQNRENIEKKEVDLVFQDLIWNLELDPPDKALLVLGLSYIFGLKNKIEAYSHKPFGGDYIFNVNHPQGLYEAFMFQVTYDKKLFPAAIEEKIVEAARKFIGRLGFSEIETNTLIENISFVEI